MCIKPKNHIFFLIFSIVVIIATQITIYAYNLIEKLENYSKNTTEYKIDLTTIICFGILLVNNFTSKKIFQTLTNFKSFFLKKIIKFKKIKNK